MKRQRNAIVIQLADGELGRRQREAIEDFARMHLQWRDDEARKLLEEACPETTRDLIPAQHAATVTAVLRSTLLRRVGADHLDEPVSEKRTK